MSMNLTIIRIVCLPLTLFLFTVAAAQQGGKIPRVGILFIGGRDQPHLEAFKQGLQERGYVEGRNIVLEYRYAEGNVDRLPPLAAELVQLTLNVIVTTSGNSAHAVTQATKIHSLC
jgi:putative ABC transport system substrate-binding protein